MEVFEYEDVIHHTAHTCKERLNVFCIVFSIFVWTGKIERTMNTCARGITEAASLMKRISVKPPKPGVVRLMHVPIICTPCAGNSNVVITIWFISSG